MGVIPVAESKIKKDMVSVRTLSSGDDLDTLFGVGSTGLYTVTTGVSNSPADWVWLLVICSGYGTVQVVFAASWAKVRAYTGSPLAWTSWKDINGDNWQSAILASESYGILYGYYNTAIKMATLVWRGNNTAPTAGTHNFTLPAVYRPRISSLAPLRQGDSMEIGTDCVFRLTTTTSNWSGGTITYPLA